MEYIGAFSDDIVCCYIIYGFILNKVFQQGNGYPRAVFSVHLLDFMEITLSVL